MKRDFNTAAELGGWFARGATGRRLSQEVAAVLSGVAVEVHGYARVQGVCDCENHPSFALMEKLGFTHEGTAPPVRGRRAPPRDDLEPPLRRVARHPPAASLAAECEAYD